MPEPEPESEPPSDEVARRFREVLGRYPAGVAVVTTAVDGEYFGMAVNSFTSVSLAPPLVGFFAVHRSQTLDRIRRSGRFCVNVLAGHQRELCRQFASATPDRFAGVEWTPAPATAAPLLAHTVAHVEARVENLIVTGDHTFVLGRVLELGALSDGAALIYTRGEFCAVHPDSHGVASREDADAAWIHSLATFTGFGC